MLQPTQRQTLPLRFIQHRFHCIYKIGKTHPRTERTKTAVACITYDQNFSILSNARWRSANTIHLTVVTKNLHQTFTTTSMVPNNAQTNNRHHQSTGTRNIRGQAKNKISTLHNRDLLICNSLKASYKCTNKDKNVK
jgi:hypothetical protein